jgi:hypothetical protein
MRVAALRRKGIYMKTEWVLGFIFLPLGCNFGPVSFSYKKVCFLHPIDFFSFLTKLNSFLFVYKFNSFSPLFFSFRLLYYMYKVFELYCKKILVSSDQYLLKIYGTYKITSLPSNEFFFK